MLHISKAIVAILLYSCTLACTPKTAFETYFLDQNLRIDYLHIGDSELDSIHVDEELAYGKWAGSKINLVDTLKLGAYLHKIVNPKTGEVIYSRGFDSYFKEYQMSSGGLDGVMKTFHETAMVPMPKITVDFVVEKRQASGAFKVVFSKRISPDEVVKTTPEEMMAGVKVFQSQNSGDAAVKADVVMVAEGYRADEEEKFKHDLTRFTEAFFKTEPCRSNRGLFNIYGVFKASEDSGVDEPRAGIQKNTVLNATFNSLGSERYLLTEDNKSLRDIASHVPYDALYIMVNSKRYGGGGIYNFYCTFTSDNIWSEYLMVHEFGHSFFGLADEYYSSATAYESFYPEGYEPIEANITAETDPAKVKWRHLFSAGIEVPTPWAKAAYDKVDRIWQTDRVRLNNKIANLQKQGGSTEGLAKAKADYDALSKERAAAAKTFLEDSPYFNKVGLFEGAGYASTGLYRGSINCIMFTRTDYFCPVCQEAMTNVIQWYAQ